MEQIQSRVTRHDTQEEFDPHICGAYLVQSMGLRQQSAQSASTAQGNDGITTVSTFLPYLCGSHIDAMRISEFTDCGSPAAREFELTTELKRQRATTELPSTQAESSLAAAPDLEVTHHQQHR
ncbi:MAG: hypothetical protein AAGI88_21365, partial [Pseudomonadota bacterium]